MYMENEDVLKNSNEVLNNEKNLKKIDYEVIWEGQPAGLFDRFLELLHLNFTIYQITKDELIITTYKYYRIIYFKRS